MRSRRSPSRTGTTLFTKIDLGYYSGAEGEYGVYNTSDGNAGYSHVWCHIFTTRIEDFLSEGNLAWRDDSYYDSYMGNAAGHEIGHSLGYGHSSSPAVMQTNYWGSWPTSDDVAGMNAMYP
jgi:predicted Zn-dependent protease